MKLTTAAMGVVLGTSGSLRAEISPQDEAKAAAVFGWCRGLGLRTGGFASRTAT